MNIEYRTGQARDRPGTGCEKSCCLPGSLPLLVAYPFPGSTHNDTLINLILHLREMGAKSITIGERSGPPETSDVLKEKGIYGICKKLAVKLINFEDSICLF